MKFNCIAGKRGSFAAIDFSAATAVIALIAAVALAGLHSNAAHAAGLLEIAKLERRAIVIADWLAKHCENSEAGGEGFGIAFCENSGTGLVRASHVVAFEGFQKAKDAEGTLEFKEFFGLGENERVSISLAVIAGQTREPAENFGGACVARLVLLKNPGQNFSSSMLGRAGLDEAVFTVCAKNT